MRGYDGIVAYLGLAAATTALVEAAFYSVYAAIALGAAGAVVFFARVRDPAADRLDREVQVFVEGILMELKAGRSLIAAMERANSPSLPFSRDVGESINRYKASLDPEYSFGPLMRKRSEKLKALASLLISAMESGSPAKAFLKEFGPTGGLGAGDSGHKVDAAFGASAMVSSLGSVVFFPVFAGISTGILGVISGPNALQSGGVSLMFAFFIVVSNYYGSRHQGHGGMPANYGFVLSSLAALLIMRAVSIASIVMI